MSGKDSTEMHGEPLVSVLTPVYNGEKYLTECIESVLAQTYRNWEYVIVNNCSTDRSREIAHAYAQKDARIRIHDNPKLVGATENHNIAFRQISPASKYCKVVHADDWLFPECLRQMVAVGEANPTVALVGAYRLDGTRVNLDGLPYPSTVVPGRELCRSTLLGGPYVFGSPTSLLIRSDCIRRQEVFYDPRFSLQTDTAACYEVLQNADFGFVHQVLTYTRRHAEAQTSFAHRMNTYIVASLTILKKYGPIYLDPPEYARCLSWRMKRYYRFLAKSLLRRRDKEFWDYHRNALENLGSSLLTGKLWKALGLETLDMVLHPIKTFGQALGSLGKEGGPRAS